MVEDSYDALVARFAAKAPFAGTCTGSRKEHGRCYLRSAPKPAAAAAKAASLNLCTETTGRLKYDQHNSGVDDSDGDTHIAHVIQADTAETSFGLEFIFAVANVSPKQLHAREESKRVAKVAYICTAEHATKATKPPKGTLVWHIPLDHLISNDFRRWDAKDELPRLASQTLLQLGKSRIFSIYGTKSAEHFVRSRGCEGRVIQSPLA